MKIPYLLTVAIRAKFVGLAVLIAFVFFAPSAFSQEPPVTLEIGKPIEREIRGTDVHTYTIELEAEQYLYATAEQKGVDVVVRFYAPGGVLLLEVDMPTGTRGSEPVYHVADMPGTYRLEISPLAKDAKPGKYEIKLVELRPGDADDQLFVRAKNTILDGYRIEAARGPDFEKATHQKFLDAAEVYVLIENNLKAKASGFSQLGAIFRGRRKPDIALDYYDKAFSTFNEAGQKRDGMLALVASTTVSPNNLDRLSRHHRILSIAREIGEKRTEASALTEIGTTNVYLGDHPVAVAYLTEAVRFSRAESLNEHLRRALNNLGAVYSRTNDLASALAAHEEVLVLNKRLDRTREDNDTILNIGNVYSRLGNDSLAMETYQKALAGFEATKSPVGAAFALSNIGSIYQGMGNTEKAIEYYDRAQVLKDKIAPNDPNRLISLAAIYSSASRPRDALELLAKGMEMCKKLQNLECQARTLVIMSNATFQLGEYQKALEFASEAAQIAERFGYDEHGWASDFSAARAHIKLGSLPQARRLLEASIAKIENLRAKTTFDASSGSSSGSLRPYRTLIGMLVDQLAVDDALSLSEKTKARSLMDVLATTRVDVQMSMTAAELASEKDLRRQMASINSELVAATDPGTRNEIEERLRAKRLEFEALRTRLYAVYPQLRIARAEMALITAAETLDLIPNERSIILQFVQTDEKALLFIGVRNGQNPVWRAATLSPKLKDTVSRINTFREMLGTGDLDFQKTSRELYDLLLRPVEKELAGKTNIIIVPDGPLWDLPFQALMDEKGKYLIEKAAVSYAPSLTALREMRKKAATRRPSPNAELVAFGNPIVGQETKERVQRVFMSEKLEPIPEAERLVNSLAKMYGPKRSKVFTGADAREEVAKTESPKYRIVQFATHGILNNVSPMYSHLVLAQNDKNPNEDGLLEAWELKDLDLKADMVILSACDTARGKISNGEGVIGMTWASFIAGAPTTVASQWKVESSSTTELMLEFHRQLLSRQKISKAEALRRASLKLMKMPRYKHPSYWAGFDLVGDGS